MKPFSLSSADALTRWTREGKWWKNSKIKQFKIQVKRVSMQEKCRTLNNPCSVSWLGGHSLEGFYVREFHSGWSAFTVNWKEKWEHRNLKAEKLKLKAQRKRRNYMDMKQKWDWAVSNGVSLFLNSKTAGTESSVTKFFRHTNIGKLESNITLYFVIYNS